MGIVSKCQVLVGDCGIMSRNWEHLLPVVDVSWVDAYNAVRKPNAFKARGRPIGVGYYAANKCKLHLGKARKITIRHRRRGAVLERADIAGGVSGRGSRRATLVGRDRAIGRRNRSNGRTRGLKRDGLGGPAVILQPIGGEQRLDVVSYGIAIGAGAGSTKTTRTVIGDIVAAVGAVGDRT
jgi:hypothetical protein